MSEDTYKTGNVKWYNHDKGYGFITPENGKDVFVHAKNLEKSGIMSGLNEGAAVRFLTEIGPKGLFATNISFVKVGVDA